jgi:hypothetical protein
VANYYTKFCISVELQSEDEFDWWDSLNVSEPEEAANILNLEENTHMRQSIIDMGGLSFSITFSSEKEDVQRVFIFTEDSGDPDQAATAVQEFLNHFDRFDVITFGVAYTCSRPTPDAYGGAGYVVTKDTYNSIDAVYAAENMFL